MLIAIDPGEALGWAVFDAGVLFRCGLNDPPRLFHRAVIERPKIYPQGRQQARPVDIITLALCAGEWGGRLKDEGAEVEYVEPDKWKGGPISKETHQPRIWAKLSETEKNILDVSCKGIAPGKRNNVVDAVGIGLYAVGRQA